MYAVYKREPDPEDIDRVKYASTLFTVGSSMILAADVVGAVIVTRAAGTGIAGLTKGLSAKGIWSGSSTIFSAVYADFNYYNPDPNPTGKGERYINMIASENEWMLSNCTHGNEWIYIDDNGYFFDYNV